MPLGIVVMIMNNRIAETIYKLPSKKEIVPNTK